MKVPSSKLSSSRSQEEKPSLQSTWYNLSVVYDIQGESLTWQHHRGLSFSSLSLCPLLPCLVSHARWCIRLHPIPPFTPSPPLPPFPPSSHYSPSKNCPRAVVDRSPSPCPPTRPYWRAYSTLAVTAYIQAFLSHLRVQAWQASKSWRCKIDKGKPITHCYVNPRLYFVDILLAFRRQLWY